MENPELIVDEFRHAAKLALDAGFDGVECECSLYTTLECSSLLIQSISSVHGANGYLIHQFIDSTSNTRTDKWGGSPQNRCRFPLELLKACVSVFGKGRVAIKLSPTGGYNDMGYVSLLPHHRACVASYSWSKHAVGRNNRNVHVLAHGS